VIGVGEDRVLVDPAVAVLAGDVDEVAAAEDCATVYKNLLGALGAIG
jgi:hypothetical protein